MNEWTIECAYEEVVPEQIHPTRGVVNWTVFVLFTYFHFQEGGNLEIGWAHRGDLGMDSGETPMQCKMRIDRICLVIHEACYISSWSLLMSCANVFVVSPDTRSERRLNLHLTVGQFKVVYSQSSCHCSPNSTPSRQSLS